MARYVKDGRAVIIDAVAQIDAFKAVGWVEEPEQPEAVEQEPEEVEPEAEEADADEEPEEVEPEPKPKRTRKAKADE